MLKLLSALASIIVLLGLTGMVTAQCPPATIGAYFDPMGTLESFTPIQHQYMYMYVVLFAEAPVGGAAWALEMTSPQYTGDLIGPEGPNSQPPWGPQDPPFWYIATISNTAVSLGDPFNGGMRQGFTYCQSGFFGNPILLATVIIVPWADILGTVEVDVTVVPEQYEGLVYADCFANICDTVVGLTTHISATVIGTENESWGAVKALYR